MGKLTLPEATGTSPWLWVAALLGVGLASLVLLSSRRKPVADEQHRTDKPGVRVGSSV